jgi:hypothetical protein
MAGLESVTLQYIVCTSSPLAGTTPQIREIISATVRVSDQTVLVNLLSFIKLPPAVYNLLSSIILPQADRVNNG